jgi:hypothetical protein
MRLFAPRRSPELREKFGRLVEPREKQVARFRMLKKIVDSSNTGLLLPIRIEVVASWNSVRNFSQSGTQFVYRFGVERAFR